jgi:hypothetical protein
VIAALFDSVRTAASRLADTDLLLIDRILEDYKPIAHRLRGLIDALQPRGLVRQRRREEGEEIDRRAIDTYCLTLDPGADDDVARIFGTNRYTVLDRVQQLTERLPALFLNLTR